MLKPFTLLIATLCLLCACNDDDTTMPAYQFALADMSTNIHGTATQLNFDDGNTYQLKAAVTKLKPDTTYRMQVLYVMNDDGKAQLYNYVPILAPQVVRYSTGMAFKHPLNVVTYWQTSKYINLQLNIKGTAKGVHYFGFNETDFRTNADGSHTMMVELVYNQNSDPLYYTRSTYLSLPLQPLHNLLRTGIDSLQLTINTFSGKQVYKFIY